MWQTKIQDFFIWQANVEKRIKNLFEASWHQKNAIWGGGVLASVCLLFFSNCTPLKCIYVCTCVIFLKIGLAQRNKKMAIASASETEDAGSNLSMIKGFSYNNNNAFVIYYRSTKALARKIF
jgi:hypothetical protein